MKKKKLLISIMAAILAAVMLLSLVFSILPSTAFAKSSAEIQAEIDALKESQASLQGQMDELRQEQAANRDETEDIVAEKDRIDREINLLHGQIDNVNIMIQTYSNLIAAKQDQLDEAEAKLDELSAKNKDRVRAMEEEGKLSYWSVLFKSHSFTDFLDRLHMMDEIAAADERRLIELNEAAQVVADARAELEQDKAELQQNRADLDEMQADLDAKRVESDEILVKLDAKAREMKNLYAEYEAREDSLVSEIANAEAEYTRVKQEEEAAAAAAAEAERRRQEQLAQQNQGSSGGSSSGGSSSGGGSSYVPSSGGWVFPCAYAVLTCAYGYRTHPVTGQVNSFHTGVDLAAASGTSIYASRSGTVTTATYSDVYGYYVVINHGDGFSSLYGHMTNYIVSPGEYVSAGQTIGYMGSTGWSTGPHLHFTIYYNGSTVNPMNYI